MPEGQLVWGGLATSWLAGKRIANGKPFTLRIGGEAAEAIRTVVRPGVRLTREAFSKVAGQWSLSTLPALMLFALGRGYELKHEAAQGGDLLMHFNQPVAHAGGEGPAGRSSGGGKESV